MQLHHRVECHDDDNRIVFTGVMIYADGGYFGVVDDATGEEREWAAELTRIVVAETKREAA